MIFSLNIMTSLFCTSSNRLRHPRQQSKKANRSLISNDSVKRPERYKQLCIVLNNCKNWEQKRSEIQTNRLSSLPSLVHPPNQKFQRSNNTRYAGTSLVWFSKLYQLASPHRASKIPPVTYRLNDNHYCTSILAALRAACVRRGKSGHENGRSGKHSWLRAFHVSEMC